MSAAAAATATELSSSAIRRAMRDLRDLTENPVALAGARPRGEDFSVWDGAVGVQLKTGLHPMHLEIRLPTNYPLSAPQVGFSCEFPYRMGASYTKSDGPLKGKMVICLDLLGNFADVHTEWAQSEGSGWSPAYTIGSLLLNLQTLFCDLQANLSDQEQQKLTADLKRFAKEHADLLPELADPAEIAKQAAERERQAAEKELQALQSRLSPAALAFAKDVGFALNKDFMTRFLEIIAGGVGSAPAAAAAVGGGAAAETSASSGAQDEADVVDKNIVCYITGSSYTEDILGYGISLVQQGKNVNLTTPGELLSLTAWKDGVRQSSRKAPFSFFMPAFINRKHSVENPKWVALFNECFEALGRKIEASGLVDGAMKVFPKLINFLIVEMMKPETDKRVAVSYFETLCSFWRTLYYQVSSNQKINDGFRKFLTGFVTLEANRHKDNAPDLGQVLVMYLVCPNVAPLNQFVDAWLDEAFIRTVMWWSDSCEAKSDPVFKATQISRDLFLFQLLSLRVVVGPNPAATADAMDKTNGKIPKTLEKLLKDWQALKANVKTWDLFFRSTGCSEVYGKRCLADINGWLSNCVRRSKEKGGKYVRNNGGGRPRR